jgi:hypothetical protein
VRPSALSYFPNIDIILAGSGKSVLWFVIIFRTHA